MRNSFRSAFLTCAILALALGVLWTTASCGASHTASSTPPSSSPSPTPSPSPSPSPSPTPSVTCPTVTLAENAGPTTGVAPFPPAAPVPPPNPGSTSAGSVCVSNPANNASVTSPVQVNAVASLANPIYFMRIYVDGTTVYFTFYNTINALLWMATGQHTVEVIASDTSGNVVSTTFQVSVTMPQSTTVSSIQNLSGWEPCSAVFPPGDPRAGQICAAGLGTAVSSMLDDQSSPSLSGSSAKFTMGGSVPYSNELYTKFLGGGSNVTHFTYDLYFMVDQPDNPQALEFDVNQTINNSRWTFGTECNFKADGKWDVWNGAPDTGWQATSAPCTPFPANTWIHLVWNFERVGNQVHYITLQVNNQTYNIDAYYSYQPSWVMQDIDVAFQMDGDFAQQPYNVWLDNVTLTAY